MDTATETKLPNAVKEIEEEFKVGEIYSVLFLKRGTLVTIHFRFKGSFYDAVGRAKLYCERMRVRFLQCKPFITDLTIDEKKMENFG